VDTVSFTAPATAAGNYYPLGSSTLTPGYDLNPENDLVFPWLSSQAVNWELYRFTNVRFRLIPKQSATSVGWITMAYDYDYADTPANTKREILTNMSVSEGSSFMELLLNVDVGALNRVHQERYIQSSAPTTLDPRQIFAGYLELGIDGAAASTSYSWDLWVDYEVVLSISRSGHEVTDSTITSDSKVIGGTATKTFHSIPIPSDLGTIGTVSTPLIEGVTLSMPSGWTGFSQPLQVIKTSFNQLTSNVSLIEGVHTPVPAIANTVNNFGPYYQAWDAAGASLGGDASNAGGCSNNVGNTKFLCYLGKVAPLAWKTAKFIAPYIEYWTVAPAVGVIAGTMVVNRARLLETNHARM
jgi:hypothetical protein